MATLVEQVKSTYHLALSQDYVERCVASCPALTAAALYKKALGENFKDITDASSLPFGIASQQSATLPNDVVLQISTSRDATQPLRLCADATEEEAALNAALQKSNSRRLLRLMLTDGHVDIPAFELKTLSIFKGVPIPGEKLLIRSGAEVRNGAIIMTESCATPVGGEVTQLRTEFLAHRRRMEAGYQISGGLEGAPKFQPIQAIVSGAAGGQDRGLQSRGGSGMQAAVSGRSGRGGNNSGKTGGGGSNEPHRGRGSGNRRGSGGGYSGESHERGGHRGGRGGRGNTGYGPAGGGNSANPAPGPKGGHDLSGGSCLTPCYGVQAGYRPNLGYGGSAGYGPGIGGGYPPNGGYAPHAHFDPSGGHGNGGYSGNPNYGGNSGCGGVVGGNWDGQRGRCGHGGGRADGRGRGGGGGFDQQQQQR